MPDRVRQARRAAAAVGVARRARPIPRARAESQKLLNWGFQAFDTVELYQAGKTVSSLRVWKGTAKEVGAGFVANRYVTLPKGRAADLKLAMHATEPLVAPVTSGQRVGTVDVRLDDKSIAEFPLIALADVPAAGFFGRTWDIDAAVVRRKIVLTFIRHITKAAA